MPQWPNHAREVRHGLTDPRALCAALGLLGAKGSWAAQHGGGLSVRCPWHEEKTPSCSVTLARDGTIRVKCFGCDRGSDALGLIAAARGFDLKRDFREVLRVAAELAGMWSVVQEIDARAFDAARPEPPPAPVVEPEPDRDYPPRGDVAGFWDTLGLTSEDPEVAGWLRGRALDPDVVDGRELARALPVAARRLPAWAVCRGGTWAETGYRLIVPMYGPAGEILTVRAGRVVDGDGPKRRPPFGHKASGVVMADGFGVAMLQGRRAPERIVVCEGEPDFLSWATRTRDASTAVLGIVGGSWTRDLVARLPRASLVFVATDRDPAGDRYAAEIVQSVRGRCFVRRLK